VGRPRKAADDGNAVETVNDISVTIIVPASDLPMNLFLSLESWLQDNTTQGFFGYERGGQVENGHAQGVIRSAASLYAHVTTAIPCYRPTGIKEQRRLDGKLLYTPSDPPAELST
jgi:hypothetical protein